VRVRAAAIPRYTRQTQAQYRRKAGEGAVDMGVAASTAQYGAHMTAQRHAAYTAAENMRERAVNHPERKGVPARVKRAAAVGGGGGRGVAEKIRQCR